MIVENDFGRVRVAAITYAVAAGLQFLALARYPGSIDWTGARAWAYVVFVAMILGVGAFGALRGYAGPRVAAARAV